MTTDLVVLAQQWATRARSGGPVLAPLAEAPAVGTPGLRPEDTAPTKHAEHDAGPTSGLPAALVAIHHGASDGYSTCKRAWISEFGSKGTLDPAAVTCPHCRRKLPGAPAGARPNPAPLAAPGPPPPAAIQPRRLPIMRRTQESAFVVYRGPSAFDGAPILAIVTGATGARGAIVKSSKNVKTGPMAQLWILAAGEAPHMAQKSGADASVCGDCRLRHGTAQGLLCYVETRKGPRSTWEANADAPVRLAECAATLQRSKADLRLGAYGDPAALPPAVIETLAGAAAASTGYTHAWRRETAAWLRPFAMASCETEEDVRAAARAGWRTFRIVEGMGSQLLDEEVLCPAATHGTRCIDCGLCNGARGQAVVDTRKSVAIPVHGRQRRPPAGALFPAPAAPARPPRAKRRAATIPDLGSDDGSERYRVLTALRAEPSVQAAARRAGIPLNTFRRRARWYQAGNVDPPTRQLRVANKASAAPAAKAKLSYRTTSRDEERDLVLRYQGGDNKAGEALLEIHAPIIHKWAKRYSGKGADFDDLLQEARLGFLKGVEKFDVTLGFKLNTYAPAWARQQAHRYLANHGSDVRVPAHLQEKKAGEERMSAGRRARRHLSLDAPIGDEDGGTFLDQLAGDDNPAQEVEEADADARRRAIIDAIRAAVETFSPRRRAVYERRLAVDEDDAATLQEVANAFGVSREQIRMDQKWVMTRVRRAVQGAVENDDPLLWGGQSRSDHRGPVATQLRK